MYDIEKAEGESALRQYGFIHFVLDKNYHLRRVVHFLSYMYMINVKMAGSALLDKNICYKISIQFAVCNFQNSKYLKGYSFNCTHSFSKILAI